jgi:hypothetical protein
MRGPEVSIKAVGSTPTRQEVDVAFSRLLSGTTGLISADQTADMLNGLVRVVAARDAGVGTNLMTIIVNPPGHGQVICRFSPLGVRSQVVIENTATGEQTQVGPADFSPWIVSQHARMSPSVIMGGATGTMLSIDGVEVVLEGPPTAAPSSGVFFAMSSQRPPARPARQLPFP